MPKPCKKCGKEGHSAWLCRLTPRTQLRAKTAMKPHKPLKKIGKMGRAYIVLRNEYFKDHPGGLHYCFYCLHVGITYPLTVKQTQVEHFLSKARHTDLRLDKSNLVASCAFHNKWKGSKDGPEFLEILDKAKAEYEAS